MRRRTSRYEAAAVKKKDRALVRRRSVLDPGHRDLSGRTGNRSLLNSRARRSGEDQARAREVAFGLLGCFGAGEEWPNGQAQHKVQQRQPAAHTVGRRASIASQIRAVSFRPEKRSSS